MSKIKILYLLPDALSTINSLQSDDDFNEKTQIFEFLTDLVNVIFNVELF